MLVGTLKNQNAPGSTNKVEDSALAPSQRLLERTRQRLAEQALQKQLPVVSTASANVSASVSKTVAKIPKSAVEPSNAVSSSVAPKKPVVNRRAPFKLTKKTVIQGSIKLAIHGSIFAVSKWMSPVMGDNYLYSQILTLPGWLSLGVFRNTDLSQPLIDSLAQFVYLPTHYGNQLASKMIKSFVDGAFNDATPKLVNYLCSGLPTVCMLYGMGPGNLITQYLPQAVNQYGAITYMIAPTIALLAERGPQIIPASGKATAKTLSAICGGGKIVAGKTLSAIDQGLEISNDFFDQMNGTGSEMQAGDEGDIITRTLGGVASGIGSSMSWLWNKAKQTAAAASQVQETLEEQGVPLRLG